ncbi:MAG: hypothetical protein ABIH72_00430 [archaeon]
MKININISNKAIYTLLAIAFIIALGGIVFAVAGVSHDASELTGVCRTDGTGCPVGGTGNKVAVYKIPSYCVFPGVLSTNSTCMSAQCASGEFDSPYYYFCTGVCIPNPSGKTSPQICPNTLVGNFYIE